MDFWQTQPVKKRQDGSYVIDRNGYPYHVPNDGEFSELWSEVHEYALQYPDTVTEEAQPPPPSQEEVQAALLFEFTKAIQVYLDEFAKTRNYDGILSAATYATSTVPKFRAEGQYAVAARDMTWAGAYEILADVETGARPQPTLEEVMAELPALRWPDEAGEES